MNFDERLRQEVSTARSTGEAKRIIREHYKPLARLAKAKREELLAELMDMMRELPA